MSLPVLNRRPAAGLGNLRSSPGDPHHNIDWTLFVGQAVLTVAGCFVVYSATWTQVEGAPYTFVTRQVIFAIAASAAMALVMAVDYEWLRERARLIYVTTLFVLLGLVVYGRLGSGGTVLAFEAGPIQVQPAELAKFTVLVALCAHLADDRNDDVDYARFLRGLLIVGAPTVLILAQPDLGSASVLVAMAMGVLLVAGAKARYIFTVSLLGVATVGAAFVGRLVDEYQLDRLRVFLGQEVSDDAVKDSAFQVTNAVRAVGTGGVFGKGWLQGPLTNARDIPVVWADFPFAAVGEQFGLVGGAALLLVFVVVLVRIWRIAHLSRDMFGTYLCAGVFTMTLWQLFQNVGMTIGIMPVTGLPMPFISYGGSSLITYFVMFGVVQSVHMRRMR